MHIKLTETILHELSDQLQSSILVIHHMVVLELIIIAAGRFRSGSDLARVEREIYGLLTTGQEEPSLHSRQINI